MKINANVQAMYTQAILANNEEKLSKSTQKMSSGYMLNRAKDNPAGMAISNRMKARLNSLEQSNKNSKNAINAVQTADGGLAEIENMLQRMNELAVQGANGLMTETDRDAIQEEIDQLTNEISRISKNTTFNTQSLFDGSQALKGYVRAPYDPKVYSVRDYNENFTTGNYEAELSLTYGADGNIVAGATLTNVDNGQPVNVKAVQETLFYDDANDPSKVTGISMKIITTGGGEVTLDAKVDSDIQAGNTATWTIGFEADAIGGMKIQTGAEGGHEVQVVIPEVSLKTLNFVDLDGNRTLDMTTEESSARALSQIEKAIDYVSAARGKVGAYQNRIEKTITNLDASMENLTESYSTIKDIDMAEGMVEYTTLQVLVQAGNTMLAQANEQPQQALQLLQ